MMETKNNNQIIIGIDHGFSMMKTAHGVFPNGLKRLQGEATLISNTLKLDGNTYKIGEGRLPVKDDKVSDEDYFVLTVASVCKELKHRGLNEASVVIAAGLPFSRYGIERQAFQNYLNRESEILASLDGENYTFLIDNVFIFPQCYAAIVSELKRLDGEALAVDIGSKTIDILHIVNHVPVESESTSIPGALIERMETIKSEVYRQTNRKVTETQIQAVITDGTAMIPDECVRIIREGLHGFVSDIEAKMCKLGFDIDMMPVIYAGGGACIMRKFRSGTRKNVRYIEDIKANAIGYELLCKSKLERR